MVLVPSTSLAPDIGLAPSDMIIGNNTLPDSGGTDSNAASMMMTNGSAASLAANYTTALSGSCSVMLAYIYQPSTGQQAIRLALYADNGSGHPVTTAFLVTSEVAISHASYPAIGWVSFPVVGAPVAVPAGRYHTGVWFGTVTTNRCQIGQMGVATAGNQDYNTSVAYVSSGSPPTSSGWTNAAGQYCVYAQVDASTAMPGSDASNAGVDVEAMMAKLTAVD
jgi:hypothetical protein